MSWSWEPYGWHAKPFYPFPKASPFKCWQTTSLQCTISINMVREGTHFSLSPPTHSVSRDNTTLELVHTSPFYTSSPLPTWATKPTSGSIQQGFFSESQMVPQPLSLPWHHLQVGLPICAQRGHKPGFADRNFSSLMGTRTILCLPTDFYDTQSSSKTTTECRRCDHGTPCMDLAVLVLHPGESIIPLLSDLVSHH